MTQHIAVDCAKEGVVNGKTIYTIAVAATSANPTSGLVSDYFLAKFSTLGNLTEWVVNSRSSEPESSVGVHIDQANQQIYLFASVGTNMYQESYVQERGDEPKHDNPNIAVIAYSYKNAVRNWVTLVGNSDYEDYFKGVTVYNNNLVIATTSDSLVYHTTKNKDIMVFQLRCDSGMKTKSKVYGSTGADEALDIFSDQRGVFLLA